MTRQSARGLIGAAAILGSLMLLLWLERRRPLRHPRDPGVARIKTNVSVAALTGVVLASIENPLVKRLSRLSEVRQWGIASRFATAPAARTLLAVVLMDYTLYWWHVLMHRVPALWRCHQPHHIDRDLDTTTALRFHFAEFAASIPWRCAQIIIIGVGPRALSLWQKLTAIEVMFHHSNLRLPIALERCLTYFVVTPRLHGIHHSVVADERDSNFSSGLTLWDRLHGTARLDLSHQPVIGIPGFETSECVGLRETLALPFKNDDVHAEQAHRLC